jgi:NarL family two-component system response regulator LiaR
MTEPMPKRIATLIVDDQPVVRQGVRAFLEAQSDIDVVAEASSGADAIALVIEHCPDVVLMDLIMPGMDGVEATRRVKEACPQTCVVILTSFHDDEHVLPAVLAGATSYLLKDVSPAELVDAVRKAVRGESALHPNIASLLMKGLRDKAKTERHVKHDLSDRELEVLRLLADGLSNALIATQLFISEKTVKSHVSSILNKLQLSDRTQAAVYAWREGLMQK